MAKVSKVAPESTKQQPSKKYEKSTDDDATTTAEGQVLSDGSERSTEDRLIDPNSEFMRNWDLLSMGFLLFVMFVTPFEVAYLTTELNVLFFINRLIDVFFISDMVIQFFLMYRDEEKGMLVKDHKMIIRSYTRGWFWIDLVAILPFDMVGVVASSDDMNNLKILRIARLLRLFKLLRILRAGRMFERWETSMAINYSILTLCKFVALTIVVAHWLACLWHMTVNIEAVPVNWVTNYGDPANPNEELSTAEVYIVALYWAVMTMSTIGYGDVTPVTTAERITATFGMFIGSSIFAYIVGAVTSTVAAMGLRQTQFYELMDSINLYMEEVQLPQPVRVRIREFFRHRYNTGSLQAEQNMQILELLSPALQETVATHTHASWIRDIKFFKTCPDEFVTKVAMKLQNHTFSPHEVIIHLGEGADNLYIVKAGVCAAKGVIYTKGQVFGDDMITSVVKSDLVATRGYQARALTFSDVYDLPKESLKKMLDDYPEVRETVRKLACRFIFRESVLGYNNAVTNLMTGQRMFTQDRNLVESYENKLALLLPSEGGEAAKELVDEVAAAKSNMIQKMHSLEKGGMGTEADLVVAELKKLADALKGLQSRVNGLEASSDIVKRVAAIEARQMLDSGVPLLSEPPAGNKSKANVSQINEQTATEIDPSLDWAPQSLTSPKPGKKSGIITPSD